MSITFDLRKIKNSPFWKCELKPSEHARKIFFNYSKLVLSFLCKESILFITKPRFLNEFTQHYWHESFDGDSFASQSRLDAYAD